LGLAQNKDLNVLSDAASKAVKRGDYNTADTLYHNYVGLFRQQGIQKDYQYSEILAYLARRAMQMGKIGQAIIMQEEVIEVKATAPDCNFTQWASAISDLASFYSAKGDYTQAIETGQKALDMLGKKLGEKHHTYNIALANLAAYYEARGRQGDYETAVSLGEKAVKNIKKETPEYASTLNALVVYYSQIGDFDKAKSVSEVAMKEVQKRLKADGIHYATILNNQSVKLANAGNYDEAIKFALRAKECFEQIDGTQTHVYAKLLNNMATFYFHQHDYKTATELLEMSLPIYERTVNRQHPDYLRCLSDLSAAYVADGNLDKADELANESDNIHELIKDEDNTKYAMSLSKQADIFASNGNYQRAIDNGQKAFEIFQKRNDKDNMAMSLSKLATYWANDGKLDKAYEIAQRSLDFFQEDNEESTYYAQVLNNALLLYYQGGDYQTATKYGLKAQHIYEHIGDTGNIIYARILANNAMLSFVNNQLEPAIEMAQKALDIQVGILGSEHPDLVPLLYNLAIYHIKASNTKEARQKYMQALSLQSEDVRTNFLHLTSQERERYWNRKNYIFKNAPLIAYQDTLDQRMATMAYNALLFRKGILLNSDIDFRSIIKASGNHDLYQRYNKLEELQKQLASYYNQPSHIRGLSKQIKNEIYQLERTLVRDCKEYGSFTSDLEINVDDVIQGLQEDEAAIEFADIYLEGRGVTYLAFLIRKGLTHPKMIRLFSEDELLNLKYGATSLFKAMQTQSGIDSIYSDVRFGRMLWEPIINELDSSINKLYFSPTSLFYQLGIEYLPCDTLATHINDKFDVYRLSSTKMLTKRSLKSPAIHSAAVYGGLYYDMSLSQLQEQHHLLADRDGNLSAEIGSTDRSRAIDSLSLRGSVGYLPGTLHEADSIGEQLMQKGIPTKMMIGYEGTEESFKALDGQDMSIIHIATHGFYIPENDVRRHNRRLVFLDNQAENISNPLNYSGLLFSGANYVLKGGKQQDGVEDGILTANEIAQMDLNKTDLVVLSACQTGVGEIREDGVFGIQRGFKKAGVHSLLMSLWNVDDKGTVMMMTRFYQYLTDGYTKNKALQYAQKEMQHNGFSSFYWASFVLLDGM
jgi:tetratricopeptide (TPR) repeat protein